ncbi:GDSL esterase/lipase 5 [Eucalyptus grandis]|uniref:GDSL esterase/lipase 5 n=1 Tax=Eucalyptus grandis TaxID=71139 RepID=UPI00192E7E7E|nr:GDSL esterase/lipase 5 [Eucalyptus grandis]
MSTSPSSPSSLASFCRLSVTSIKTQNDVALFIFGDALNDAGTNNYINTTAFFRANFSPYGETFFLYPTGRITDGRIMADFIAEYAKLPLIPPYLQLKNDEFVGGANFASIGAGALPETFAGFVVDFKTQLKQFESLVKNLRDNLGDKKAERIVLDGVYFISIGLNDYVAVLNNPALFQSVSMEDYVRMVVGNISTVLEDGETACCGSVPYGGNYSCGGMRGVREYASCPNPAEYVFFDSNHLSERAYHQFAQLIWNGSSPTTKPYNLEALFKHGNV